MHSHYATQKPEAIEAALQAHCEVNIARQKGGTPYQRAMAMRKLQHMKLRRRKSLFEKLKKSLSSWII